MAGYAVVSAPTALTLPAQAGVAARMLWFTAAPQVHKLPPTGTMPLLGVKQGHWAAQARRLHSHHRLCHTGRRGWVPKEAAEDSKRSILRARYVTEWEQFLEDISAGRGPEAAVVLCGANPGNIGAALRLSALLGVAAVVVLGGVTANAVTKALRTSQVERKPHWDITLVPVPESKSPGVALGELRTCGWSLAGLLAPGFERMGKIREKPVPLYTVNLARPKLALVFGADEFDGEPFPPDAVTQLDTLVTIPMMCEPASSGGSLPMEDATDCLNLASAVSVVVYERMRQIQQQKIEEEEDEAMDFDLFD
eukprot:TRINITY_DN67575_c0_g1_i1.p1 TRINITY_DN67575_c0_g1~~TRINITY_DN67575_c0_g1_i1.p1  ORF type:complete len:342 (-),score=54.87 TRINITY_DN67575_c0_g1_i1:126-1052(-)